MTIGSFRRYYLPEHAFELALALLAVAAASIFFLDPTALQRSAIGQALHPFDYVWNLLYLLAGISIVVGLVVPKPRIELAGLAFLATSVAINIVAITYVRPFPLWVVSATTYVAIVLACVGRAHVLLRISALATRAEQK